MWNPTTHWNCHITKLSLSGEVRHNIFEQNKIPLEYPSEFGSILTVKSG